MSDFLKCPRLYFLRNVYKNPKSGKKMSLVSPALALGQVLHEVIESLSILPVERRFERSLLESFREKWPSVAGLKGGFESEKREREVVNRGEEILRMVQSHPGPLVNKAVKIKQELPYFWLSEELNLILCGKIDWLEYLATSDAVHVIDFKTGKTREKEDSLQLPVYYLIASRCQQRKVEKMSYWYIADKTSLDEVVLPNEAELMDKLLTIGREVSLKRKINKLECKTGGCKFCEPFERVLTGEGKLVGENAFGQELYFLRESADEQESYLL